jgi:hypothetical protein
VPLKILTDDLEEYPTRHFQRYSEVIIEMIKESYPNFSIGLYGEWGTGKTTLMKYIFNHFKSNDEIKYPSIIPVWFNAWMYERENQFALFPLLQTIVDAIPNTDENKPIKETLKKFSRGIGKGLLKSAPEIISHFLPSILTEPLKGTTKEIASAIGEEYFTVLDKVNEQLNEQILYSTQIEKIKQEITKILTHPNNKFFRIVIFVDDLDRCSPKTTLEVFESIKVFLGIEGFIYILGISNETIIKFLNFQFKDLINGDHYLRKIIQIPITLPEWNQTIISNELIDKYVLKLDNPYKNIILAKKDFITNFIEFNPREVKRFINSFIIARELFSDEVDISDKTINEIFAVQALKIRWPTFMSIFSANEEFRKIVKYFVSNIKNENSIADTINEIIDTRQKEAKLEEEKELSTLKKRITTLEKILFQFNEITDLWKFLYINQDIVFNITNWNLYNKLAKIALAKINLEEKNMEKDFESDFVKRTTIGDKYVLKS